MNFRRGFGKKIVEVQKYTLKRKKKLKRREKKILFCKTILLAVRRQSVKRGNVSKMKLHL